MNGYLLYFVPGHNAMPSDSAAERLSGTGLMEVIPKTGPSAPVADGPEGLGAGCVFAAVPEHTKMLLGEPHPICSYRPDAQTWLACGTHAVGFWNDRKPKPEDLLRESAVPGYALKLNDGCDWQVPLVRRAEGDSFIPRVIKRKPDGSLEFKVVSRYEGICQVADEIYAELWAIVNRKKDPEDIPVDRLMDISEQALGLNYHVGPLEISLLELLTTENIKGVVQHMADIPGLAKLYQANAETSPEQKNV